MIFFFCSRRACGQCTSISDPDVRKLCFQCIQGQAFNASLNLPANDTDANVCQCVYFAKNRTIAVNNTLSAMEMMCYSGWT